MQALTGIDDNKKALPSVVQHNAHQNSSIPSIRSLRELMATGHCCFPGKYSVGVIVAIVMAAILAGCASTKEVQKKEEDFFATFPAVELSSRRIHSPDGDMVVRLPEEWVTMDAEKAGSPEVFAVACNPMYTLSLVFAEIPVDDAVRQGYASAGLIGLMEASFVRRAKKMSEPPFLMEPMEEFALGQRRFGAYTYSSDSATITRVALFFTNSHLYECAITHLTFSDHELPDPKTVKEIHQIVLGSIEW